jgi:hypothetical protein
MAVCVLYILTSVISPCVLHLLVVIQCLMKHQVENIYLRVQQVIKPFIQNFIYNHPHHYEYCNEQGTDPNPCDML